MWELWIQAEPKQASIARVAFRFCKTRLILSLLLVIFSMIFQFIGPVRVSVLDALILCCFDCSRSC